MEKKKKTVSKSKNDLDTGNATKWYDYRRTKNEKGGYKMKNNMCQAGFPSGERLRKKKKSPLGGATNQESPKGGGGGEALESNKTGVTKGNRWGKVGQTP